MADLRVVEMRPPGMIAAPEKQELLPARMAAAIAAGLEPSAPASDPSASPAPDAPATQTPVEIGVDGSPGSPDFIIKDAQVPDLHSFNLPEGSQVRHSNFPPESEYESRGFIKLSDGTVYDTRRGGLWYLSENGSERIGVLAPDNWSPPDPGDAPGDPPPGLNPGQPSPNAPSQWDSSSGTPQGVEDPPSARFPYALPIVDHEGRGTLIVQNLPAAPEGHLYHLWMVDSQSSAPVNLGALKSETGGGAYGFDLPSPDFVPSRYLMTLEKEGPVAIPGSTVVLQGP